VLSSASGSGLATQISQLGTYTFTIQAVDKTNTKRNNTGNDFFEVSSAGPASIVFSGTKDNNSTYTATPNNDGTYTVTYTSPGVEGAYNISIKYLGVDDIAGSPFSVSVISPVHGNKPHTTHVTLFTILLLTSILF